MMQQISTMLAMRLLKVLPKSNLVLHPKSNKSFIESTVKQTFIKKVEVTIEKSELDLITDIECIFYPANPELEISVNWIYPHQFQTLEEFKTLFNRNVKEMNLHFKQQHNINEARKLQLTLPF